MDIFDLAGETLEQIDKDIHSIRYEIPKGKQGECLDCGTYSKRLINDLCAICRDERSKQYARIWRGF